VRDKAFNQVLWNDSMPDAAQLQTGAGRGLSTGARGAWCSFFIFHLLRWYPAWAGWLLRHAPRLTA
jgi:cardiolipin synthase